MFIMGEGTFKVINACVVHAICYLYKQRDKQWQFSRTGIASYN